MHDMGKKENNYGVESITSEKTEHIYYPTIYVKGSKLPELSKKKVGDTCKLMIEVKVKSISENSSKEIDYDLEIIKAGYVSKKKDY